MGLPTTTLGSLTATGDAVTGPGAVNIISDGLPTSCLGDAVAGAACTGVIDETEAINIICDGRPVVTTTSTVTGVNPETGVPVETAVVGPGAVNILSG